MCSWRSGPDLTHPWLDGTWKDPFSGRAWFEKPTPLVPGRASPARNTHNMTWRLGSWHSPVWIIWPLTTGRTTQDQCRAPHGVTNGGVPYHLKTEIFSILYYYLATIIWPRSLIFSLTGKIKFKIIFLSSNDFILLFSYMLQVNVALILRDKDLLQHFLNNWCGIKLASS